MLSLIERNLRILFNYFRFRVTFCRQPYMTCADQTGVLIPTATQHVCTLTQQPRAQRQVAARPCSVTYRQDVKTLRLLGISRSPRSEQSTRCSSPSPSQRHRSAQVVCPAALGLSSAENRTGRTANTANKAPNHRMSRTGSQRSVKVSRPAAAQRQKRR